MNKVKFHDMEFDVQFGRYPIGGARAIQLVDEEGVYCTASVNLPEHKMPDNCTLIKNYSENQGVLEALVAAGIVEQTGNIVPIGYTFVHECKVLHPEV